MLTDLIPRPAMLIGIAIAIAAPVASAQFGPEGTILRGVHAWVDGELVEGCDIYFAGRKIKAVGVGLPTPDGATEVKLGGRFVTPALIDAASELGLRERASGVRPNRPHHLVTDRFDMFDGDPFADALSQGVGYVYLRNDVETGIGGRGRALRVPDARSSSLDGLLLDETEALHIAIGDEAGPLKRVLAVAGLRKALESAEKYKESWEKYRKDLKKYLEELEEWAKKRKKDKKDKKDKKKPSKTKKSDSSGEAKDAKKGERFGRGLLPPSGLARLAARADGALRPRTDAPTDDRTDAVRRRLLQLPPEVPWPYPGPDPRRGHAIPQDGHVGHLRDDQEHPRLSPGLSIVGDGNEPHLRPPVYTDPTDFSKLKIPVCPHCGGIVEGALGPHDHDAGFDFYEFAPAEDEAKKDGEKDGGDEKKKKKAGKDGKAPKKPREPAFDPDKEQLVKALEGKLRVRIEVHRAEDIVKVLGLLNEHPLDAVLEGVTEGYFVADRIAASGYPVVVRAEPVTPLSELPQRSASGFPGLPFPLPFPITLPRGFGRSSLVITPGQGVADPGCAAALHRAGVPVALGSVHGGGDATPQLMLSAAYAAGHGLPRGEAVKAVTSRAAEILGWSDRLGTLSKGRLASLVVYDGDPFAAGTTVDRVYIDGKRVFKK